MITATGLVIPVDWDADGVATRFALSTFDEKEYLLDAPIAHRELLSLVQKEIRAVGQLIVEDGREIFTASAIELLPDTGPVNGAADPAISA